MILESWGCLIKPLHFCDLTFPHWSWCERCVSFEHFGGNVSTVSHRGHPHPMIPKLSFWLVQLLWCPTNIQSCLQQYQNGTPVGSCLASALGCHVRAAEGRWLATWPLIWALIVPRWRRSFGGNSLPTGRQEATATLGIQFGYFAPLGCAATTMSQWLHAQKTN